MEGVNDDVEVVGVVQVGAWVLVVAPSVAGLADELMAPLSVGGEAPPSRLTWVTAILPSGSTAYNGDVRCAVEGRAGFDELDSPWGDRIREVDDAPDSEGLMLDCLFHTLEVYLAMRSTTLASNRLGSSCAARSVR
ncbi:hypothetical protein CH254_03425 [Rhodococcus sp. 06-412-2C]|nr:hypothetical protein CH254_03425 [Rhodococcus sp. 06-412-2C]OZC92143.1 hypothetical protein CH279_24700 [Rhodococcus sp. 06-412-2B]